MADFTIRARVDAPPSVVFEVLTDHRRYSQLTPLRSSTLEREGAPSANGVGAVRVLRLAGPPLREEVTEYVPDTRFAYRLLSGSPVRDYLGTVDLVEEAGGTQVTYRVQFIPTVPGPLAPVLTAVTRLVIGQLFRGIRKRSEALTQR